MPDTIRLYGLVTDSIVDGPGFRTAIFVQGCPYHCEGCHNPDSQPFEGGTVWPLDDVEKKFSNNPLLSGITLSGGEPAEQAAPCAELARRAHQKGLNVWTYTGSTLEKLTERAQTDDALKQLLAETDVLVDGPFILAQRSLELDFCGSKNQRLIDMNETRHQGKLVLWTPPVW